MQQSNKVVTCCFMLPSNAKWQKDHNIGRVWKSPYFGRICCIDKMVYICLYAYALFIEVFWFRKYILYRVYPFRLPNRGISEPGTVLSYQNWQRIQGVQIVKSYQLMRRLAHYVVYNISITVVIVLSNEMIFGISLMQVWRTISSLKLDFKRGQGFLSYIPLLLGNSSCHVIYQKSNQISKNR